MSQDLRKVTNRLENIQKVKPILAALRTISLGSWQMARNRRAGLDAYAQRLLDVLPWIVPHVVKRGRSLRLWSRDCNSGSEEEKIVTLIVGSERGLCGSYNSVLLDRLDRYMAQRADTETEVELVVLGSRLIRQISATEYQVKRSVGLSMTSLPSYETAGVFTGDWLTAYEAYELSAVDVIYNADRGAGAYEPEVVRLVPPKMVKPQHPVDAEGPGSPPIIETDPMQLYVHIVRQWTAITLYRLLLEAAQTVHLARFQLMESATQNADRLVDDLTLRVQSARRQAITREMQELAIGAGLLRSGSS